MKYDGARFWMKRDTELDGTGCFMEPCGTGYWMEWDGTECHLMFD